MAYKYKMNEQRGMTCSDNDDDNDNEQDQDSVWDVLMTLAMIVTMVLAKKVMMRTTKIVFGMCCG